MSKNNTGVLLIDCQNDFMKIQGAALPVDGSVEDMGRVVDFVKRVNPSYLYASLDTHYKKAIFHPLWFKDKDGNPPKPYTPITSADIKAGIWVPQVDPVWTLYYTEQLELKKKVNLVIWPEHCVEGTWGHNFFDSIAELIGWWQYNNGGWPHIFTKGRNPGTEMYGVFEAEVPIPKDPTTTLNNVLLNELSRLDRLYVVGEAWNFCYLNSVDQIIKNAPSLVPKLYFLTDCSSPVLGIGADFDKMVADFYKDAQAKGVKLVKSTEI